MSLHDRVRRDSSGTRLRTNSSSASTPPKSCGELALRAKCLGKHGDLQRWMVGKSPELSMASASFLDTAVAANADAGRESRVLPFPPVAEAVPSGVKGLSMTRIFGEQVENLRNIVGWLGDSEREDALLVTAPLWARRRRMETSSKPPSLEQ